MNTWVLLYILYTFQYALNILKEIKEERKRKRKILSTLAAECWTGITQSWTPKKYVRWSEWGRGRGWIPEILRRIDQICWLMAAWIEGGGVKGEVWVLVRLWVGGHAIHQQRTHQQQGWPGDGKKQLWTQWIRCRGLSLGGRYGPARSRPVSLVLRHILPALNLSHVL